MLQAVVEYLLMLLFYYVTSSAKHAAKEGGNGKKVENHENGKNALLHENIVNTTTAGKKEDTVRTTVKEGCEGTSANTTTIHVPERVSKLPTKISVSIYRAIMYAPYRHEKFENALGENCSIVWDPFQHYQETALQEGTKGICFLFSTLNPFPDIYSCIV